MQPDKPEKPDSMDEIDVELEDQPAPKPQHSKYPAKKSGSRKRIVIIAIIAVAVLGLLGAAYWWFSERDSEEQQPAASEQTEEEPERQAPDLSPEEAAQTVTFKSETLNLEFNHRRDWTVSESENKSEITLSSPPVAYSTVGGNVPAGQGVFTLKIGKGVPQAMQDTINGSNAVRDSKVIAYDEPTDAQRFYTNLSYAGVQEAFNFFIITGSVEYKTGDPLASTLAFSDEFYLIAGGYGEDPDNALAFDDVPTSQIDSQAVKQAVDIVKSLKIF